MQRQNKLLQKELRSLCLMHGFTKKRSNYYKCCGEGLLHVIMIPNTQGLSIKAHDSRSIYWGIFSLYSKINWISGLPVKHLFHYDLHLTQEAKGFIVSEKILSQDSQPELLDVLERTILFLSKFGTHEQLAQLQEEADLFYSSRMLLNDLKKISPYVLSGQYEKAKTCISAIERQNWTAHNQNIISIPDYDVEKHKCAIETRLAPLIQLRDAISNQDKDGIVQYLQTNYGENMKKLHDLGIPISESCCVPQEKFPFLENSHK